MHDNRKQELCEGSIQVYDNEIIKILNVESLSQLETEAEKDAYYAVGMLCAYQDGVKPSLREMTTALKVSYDLIEKAFHNLRANGIFTSKYNGKKRLNIYDWCWVAGIASGVVGLKM